MVECTFLKEISTRILYIKAIEVYRNMEIIILDINPQVQGECHVLYHPLGSPLHWAF